MNHYLTKISLFLVFYVHFNAVYSQVNSDNTIPSSNVSYVVSENFNDELFQEILNLQKKMIILLEVESNELNYPKLLESYSEKLSQNCPNIQYTNFVNLTSRNIQNMVLNFEDEAINFKNILNLILDEVLSN